jgi:hypothetical protein
MSGVDQEPNPTDAGDTREDAVSGLQRGPKSRLPSQTTAHSVETSVRVSSIMRLPTEILAMIFTTRPRNWKKTHHQELTLRLVSRRWRDIVDSTPQMWATVSFSLSSWSEVGDPITSEQRLTFRLEKSKSSPLDVSINLQEGGLYLTWDNDEHDSLNHAPEHPSVALDRHLLLLTPHVHRFHSLKITSAWYSALSQTLKSLLAVAAPLVEKIKISYDRPICWDYREDIYLPFLLDGAPSLRDIKLENLSLVECSPPLASVTYLTLSMGKDAGMLDDFDLFDSVFAELTSLVWLRLEGMIFDNYEEGDPPISIPSLQYLDVRSSNYPGLDTSISCFDLPALDTLLIHDAEESFQFICSPSNGTAPKFTNVRVLDLYQRPTYEWEIKLPLLTRDIAYNFPNLESLTLFCDDKDHLHPEVAFIRDNVDCFPLLDTLDLRSGPKDSDLLLSMLQQRVASGRPVITCGFTFDWSGGVTAHLDYLESEVPPDYELDPLRPALNYIGNVVSVFCGMRCL